MSLGRAFAGHPLPKKLEAAATHGFEGVEIFYEDLDYFAREQSSTETPSDEQVVSAAHEIARLCRLHGLEVVGLQPFLFYEGLTDRAEHEDMITKLRLWFEIARALGTDLIQIPTQFRRDDGGITGDVDVIVRDMVEVADLGLRQDPPVRFAYENLAWGTFVDTWEGVWEVVRRVDRWNFGVCLDTFNIAGRVWADPASEDGTVGPTAEDDLKASIASMVRDVDVKKVWYVQVIGAERMRSPLVKGHDWHVDGQPARMSWSRNARLFYGEEQEGQYLPVGEVARAILYPVEKGGLGFSGWISMELFSRTMNETKEEVPEEHARRGAVAWKKLVQDLDLNV